MLADTPTAASGLIARAQVSGLVAKRISLGFVDMLWTGTGSFL